jgi:hypothetical protein
LGGSNAQRDLFTQMLLDAAMRAGRRDLAGEIVAHEAACRAVPPAGRAGYAAAARWLAWVPAVDKPNARVLGQPVRRIEDSALLTGQGRYVDDPAIPRCTTPARSWTRSSPTGAR